VNVIIGVNGQRITSSQDITSVLSSLRPGDTITLQLVRGTKHFSLKVTLGTAPSSH